MTRRILLTGASGRIGSFFTRAWVGKYDLLLTDLKSPLDAHGFPFVQADIADFDKIRPLFEGVDTVVHLAADHRTFATWEELHAPNIVGVRNVFEAALQAGCRRVVYASSINAVGGYPRDQQVHSDMPPRPLNLYGASKVWGEALACYYADQRGLSSLCLRYGWVIERDSPDLNPERKGLERGITYNDLAKLFEAAIEADDSLRFGIFQGGSASNWRFLDITEARRVLGFEPEDDLFALAGRPL
jgi:nucleoside-diphosphate-sugar epimerase